MFGRDRVTCEPDLPDAIQTAVNMVDAEDELGVGYGHGVLICGSFVTAGDARTMLKEHALGDLARPKAERVNPRGPHARRRRRGRVRGRRGTRPPVRPSTPTRISPPMRIRTSPTPISASSTCPRRKPNWNRMRRRLWTRCPAAPRMSHDAPAQAVRAGRGPLTCI